MSDISIPGVKSKYGTNDLVEGLMKVERIPKTRAEEELKELQKKRSVMQDLNVRMSRLRDASRNLYTFKNPFADRVGVSSNEEALTATAIRDAPMQQKSILVKQTASADRFLSGNLPLDYKVAAGDYSFQVGGKNATIKFAGGPLKEFAEAVNKDPGKIVNAQIINVEKGTQSLFMESLVTGSANRLSFKGDAESLALNSGMLERVSSSSQTLKPETGSLKAWTKPIDPSLVGAADGTFSVKAGGEVSIPFSSPVKVKGPEILEYDVRVIDHPGEAPADEPMTGPILEPSGSVTYEGIVINNEVGEVPLPDVPKKEKPVRVDTNDVLFAKTAAGADRPLPSLTSSPDFVRVQVKLSDLGTGLSAIEIRNGNTNRDVEIKNVRVFDPTETGGLKPRQPISVAGDAIISMDGIEVKRDSNNIDDLLPGATINLHSASDKPVKLSIEPDQKSSKDAIVTWIGYYNQLFSQINILSKKDDKVVDEIDFSDTEKKSAMENLGLFQGDMTLMQAKNSLQRTTMNPYPTSEGNKLNLLQQIGISTDASGTSGGGGYDPSRLRGYLEVDEKKLDDALKTRMPTIKQLFGGDSNGDLIIDTGVAFTLDSILKAYVEKGGIMETKIATYDTQIKSTKDKIATLQDKLKDKEAELKNKYSSMEGTLDSLQNTSNSLNNFNKQNNQ
jgi:flagellar hook-associated protein 2